MFRRIAQAIIESSLPSSQSSSEFPIPPDDKCVPVQLGKEGFHSPVIFSRDIPEMAFCDGGNSELIAAPNLSLQLVRGYFSVFRDNKKIFSHREQFYLLIYARSIEGSLRYSCRFFSEIGSELSQEEVLSLFKISDERKAAFLNSMGNFIFDPSDPYLSSRAERASPSKIVEIIRHAFELSLARAALRKLNKGGILILDGSLQQVLPFHNAQGAWLFNEASSNGIYLCALSKTSTLLTTSGKPLLAFLDSIAPFSEWYYFPLWDMRGGIQTCIVKLHKSSHNLFKLEFQDEKRHELGYLFWALQKNSTDYAFPGYPYGLVDADKFAQVSNEEKQHLLALLNSESGSDVLNRITSALDAHKILNRL